MIVEIIDSAAKFTYKIFDSALTVVWSSVIILVILLFLKWANE